METEDRRDPQLPVVKEGYVRLWRVDGRLPFEISISGRWFSDDPRYIAEGYARDDTQWTYVDVPEDVAERCRYERVKDQFGIYGVEGKDVFLPKEWAEERIPFDGPPYLPPKSQIPERPQPVQLTELTDNAAVVGKVLFYDKHTKTTTVVIEVRENEAVILTKNRKWPKEDWCTQVLPIRRITLTYR